MKMRIGDFFIRRLTEAGIDTLFGLPGDFNLAFLNQVTEQKKLKWVGNCNELNGSYAADGYARTHGISAILTTYGVGDLSAINGIAGAYAEYVPVIHISGAIPVHGQFYRDLTHHTMVDGGFRNVQRAMAEFTVVQAELTPENAVTEIDRAIIEAYRQKRPTHVFFPSDLTHIEIEVPDSKLELTLPYECPKMLKKAVEHISGVLSKAQKPTILLDLPAQRWGAIAPILEMAQKLNIPVAYTPTISGNVPSDNPMVIGVYAGASSSPGVQQIIESSDCLLNFGARMSDVASGYFTAVLPHVQKQIQFQPYFVRVGGTGGVIFNAAHMTSIAKGLAGANVGKKEFTAPKHAAKPPVEAKPDDHISEAVLADRYQKLLKPDDIFVADTGSSMTLVAGLKYPKGAEFVNQMHWGSIGYALPAALGVKLGAPSRRVLVSQGDGAHQLTSQELSTIMRHKLDMIFFLLNNRGYMIERSILGASYEYNDVNNWDYAGLTKVFDQNGGGQSVVVKTVKELDEAIAKAQSSKGLFMIEVRLPQTDMPQAMVDSGKATVMWDYGVAHPNNDLVVKH